MDSLNFFFWRVSECDRQNSPNLSVKSMLGVVAQQIKGDWTILREGNQDWWGPIPGERGFVGRVTGHTTTFLKFVRRGSSPDHFETGFTSEFSSDRATTKTPAMGDGFQNAEGYDRLAQFMGTFPENAVFRRFGTLAAEDLLYRQAELCELESTLRKYQKADKMSGQADRERYAFYWELLGNSTDEDAAEGNDGSQLETIMEIRKKLEEYRTGFSSPSVCLSSFSTIN